MTEEEAKTKWCPMVRHINGQFENCGNSLASMPGDGRFPKCIGSACMMWRPSWKEIVKYSKAENEVWKEPVSDGGHCGLAGKP